MTSTAPARRRRPARVEGQLAAAFTRDPWTLSGGLPITPAEDGDQLDLLALAAEVSA